jgi:peptide/nickel transport system substrate-binding protein
MGRKATVTCLCMVFLFLLASGSADRSFADPDQREILRICDLTSDAGLRMDPHMQFDERNENILNQIFEHLLELDVDGDPRPNLARSWRRLDRYTVQFKLKKGLLFHDGEVCDANAVKFSIERNINKRLRSPSSHVLKSVKRVDVVDPHTFNIITRYPDGILLNRLCVSGYIVPPRYIEKVGDREFEKHPIGTGPFKFGRWVKGQELILEKNANYSRAGLPRIDGIIFKFADARKRVDMLLSGGLDMITSFEAADLQRIEAHGFKTLKEPTFAVMSINFNLRKAKGPFQDVLVRRAANLAVDKEKLIEKVKLGYGIPRATMGMPGEFGYNPYIKPYPYDPEKAKEFLLKAGYPNGFKAIVLIDDIDGGADSRLGQELKRQLAEVGIDLTVEGGNGSTRVAGPRINRTLPVFDGDMFARICPDPLGHIIFIEGMVWYESDSPWSLLNNRELDRLCSQIIVTIDPKRQNDLCHALEEMIHEECFSLFSYQEVKLYAMTNKITYSPYIAGMLYLREVIMSQE